MKLKTFKLIIFIFIGILLFIDCQGKKGDIGPQGLAGANGVTTTFYTNSGITKIIYSFVLDTNGALSITAISELTLTDMPIVNVYLENPAGQWTPLSGNYFYIFAGAISVPGGLLPANANIKVVIIK